MTSAFPTSHTRSWDPLTGASDWLAVRVRVKSLQVCLTLGDSARFLNLWDSPDGNTGVGCRALLQGIFPTQGSNPHLLQLATVFFTTSTTWEAVLCYPDGRLCVFWAPHFHEVWLPHL